jgi:hypothetical protein
MFMAWTITSSQYEKTHNIKTSGYPQIAFVWLFSVFYSLAWSGLLVAYSLEILPYKLRAKGLMIMNLTVQAALVLGNYTNAIAWDNLKGKDWTFCLFYTVSTIPFPSYATLLTLWNSSGISSNSSSSTSSTSKPAVPPLRNSPRSSTENLLRSHTWILTIWRRMCRSLRRAILMARGLSLLKILFKQKKRKKDARAMAC